MKLSILLPLSALVATTLAQRLSDLPDCARTCATDALSKHCKATDLKCPCTNKDFLSEASCCIQKGCNNKADQDRLLPLATKICSQVGVTTGLPTALVSCSSTSASSASAATKTGTTTTQTGTTTTNTASSTSGTTSSTGAAATAWKDSSLVAAAGAAAVFAVLV